MKHQLHVENTLANEDEEKGWFRKKIMFQSCSSNNLRFSRDDMEGRENYHTRDKVNVPVVARLRKPFEDY